MFGQSTNQNHPGFRVVASLNGVSGSLFLARNPQSISRKAFLERPESGQLIVPASQINL